MLGDKLNSSELKTAHDNLAELQDPYRSVDKWDFELDLMKMNLAIDDVFKKSPKVEVAIKSNTVVEPTTGVNRPCSFSPNRDVFELKKECKAGFEVRNSQGK